MRAAGCLRRARRGTVCITLFCLSLEPLSACTGPEPPSEAGPEAGGLAQAAATVPDVVPAPAVFQASGTAVWDGRATLGGIWVAHSGAQTAQRVRVYNDAAGAATDAALFARDAPLTGPTVLVSSEAAHALGMRPSEPVELRIVALAGPGAAVAGAPPVAAASAAIR